MARIKDSSVRDVVAAADMVEVVSGRTQLRRASGSRFTGRCPFHEEKTPSFSVNPVEKLYYCFGCGKGGDIISFVRETENLDFVGAVEWLADRFRVPIEVEEASPRVEEARRRRERLYAVLDQTARTSSGFSGTGMAPRPFASISLDEGSARRSPRSSGSGCRRAKGLQTRRASAALRSTS
jgi:DNA primase